MPIGTHYNASQIQPGVIHFHGLVRVDGDGDVEGTLTTSPGVTWSHTNTGLYRCSFNDGATVGLAAFVATFVRLANNTFAVNIDGDTSTLLDTTSTFVDIETRLSGTLTDPGLAEGWSYVLVRTNSSVTVT